MKSKKQNSGHDKYSTDSGSQQTFPNGPISVVCIPPPLSDQERAEKDKNKRRESIKFWVEIAGAIILFGYFSFTILIWCANKESADAARDSVQLEQRAWIAFLQEPAHPQIGEQFVFMAHLSNYGKTPAFKLHIVATSILASINEVPEFDYSKGTGHPSVSSESNAVLPDRPNTNPDLFPVPVFISHTTVGEVATFTGSLDKALHERASIVYIHGRIDYEDIFHIHRWTTFCDVFPKMAVSSGPTPGIQICADHNQIDNN